MPSLHVSSILKDALWGLVLSVASGSMQTLALFGLPILPVVKVRLGTGRKLVATLLLRAEPDFEPRRLSPDSVFCVDTCALVQRRKAIPECCRSSGDFCLFVSV